MGGGQHDHQTSQYPHPNGARASSRGRSGSDGPAARGNLSTCTRNGAQPTGRLRPVEPLSSNPATQKALRSSDAYTKVTYRLSNEAVQAAEDMKALLKRR